MARFLDKLRTEQDKQLNTLLAPLRLEDDDLVTYEAPAGFTTDYATLKLFHNIFLFVIYALLVTYGNRAATIHDYLYGHGYAMRLTRQDCDNIFYRALRADGVAQWRATLFWVGVRLGGRSHYKTA